VALGNSSVPLPAPVPPVPPVSLLHSLGDSVSSGTFPKIDPLLSKHFLPSFV